MVAFALMHRPARTRTGFTLIEVLIVITIVGILLGTALPRVGRSVRLDRVNRAATVAQGMLDEAGQLAARRRTPVTVTVASGWLRINDRASGTAIKQRNFATGQDMQAALVSNPTAGITVFPNGRGSEALTLTLSTSGKSVSVSRTTTGIVRRQ